MAEETNSSGSMHRVAYDLCVLISQHEENDRTREYWLKLYRECLHVVKGGNA